MNHSIPKGLILAGGYSTRMGKDKSQMCYHNAPQYKYLYDLLKNCCEEVFVSCREEQKNNFVDCPILIDKYQNIGPLGALLTAFEYSATAWLVVACDMPFIDTNCLEYLLNNRNINGDFGIEKNADLTIFRAENNFDSSLIDTKMSPIPATTITNSLIHSEFAPVVARIPYKSTKNNNLFFEPLLGIWEMGAYQRLIEAFGQKEYSLQKVIKNLKVNELAVPDARWLQNINTTKDELMAQSFAQ